MTQIAEPAQQTDRDLVDAVLRRGRLAQLASVTEAGPRVFSVWFAHDPEDDAVVFLSDRRRGHSLDWEVDQRAGGTVVGVELEGLGQRVEAVGFTGTTREVTGAAVERAWEVYAGRWPQIRGKLSLEDLRSELTPMRLWSLRVDEWVLFSDLHRPAEPRVVVPPRR